jgi:hypothetical protein
MKKILFFLLSVPCFAQNFYLAGDTVVVIHNDAVKKYFESHANIIKDKEPVILTDKIVFRAGYPVQFIDGYPVQFDSCGSEIKPEEMTAISIDMTSGKSSPVNVDASQASFGKPLEVKMKPLPIKEPSEEPIEGTVGSVGTIKK